MNANPCVQIAQIGKLRAAISCSVVMQSF